MRYAVMIALGCALGGCSDQALDEQRRPLSLAEGPGSRLSAVDEWVAGGGTWDAPGTRVYYVAGLSNGGYLYAARAGGQREKLDLGPATPAAVSSATSRLLTSIAPLPDGSMLFVAWPDTLSPQATGVLRWSAGDSVSWLPGLRDVRAIAQSGDPRFLLYRSWDDALHCYDWTSGSSRRIGAGDPRVFVPGTSNLLLQTDNGAWVRHSLADGSEEAVIVRLTEGESVVDVLWDETGPRLLTARPTARDASTSFAILDLATGERRDFYEYQFDAPAVTAHLVPGGRRMALSMTVITDPCTLSSGCVPHTAVYLIDTVVGSETWVAGVRGAWTAPLTFSPDGRRAAYVADGALYALSIR
jgi:hypothetical protein